MNFEVEGYNNGTCLYSEQDTDFKTEITEDSVYFSFSVAEMSH